MTIIILIILTVALLLSLPGVWPYSRTWGAGYYPSLVLTIIILVMLILAATGHLTLTRNT
jgi:Protein of unknown function (DUF3309)